MRSKSSQLYFAITVILGMITAGAHAAVSYSGGTYTQNFDTLASTGTGIAFNDDSTLPGWYAVSANTQVVYSNGVSFSFFVPITETTRADAYNANVGGSAGTTLYSYGATDASDRALGSISDQSHDFFYALCITNDTGSALKNFTLTYDGEQWRNAADGSAEQNLLVYYRIGGTNFDSAGAWTQLTDLTFVTPTTNSPGALDGNDPANRTAGLTQTVIKTS